MNLPFTLENEVALITGGGTGLGLSMAACMVRAGARVVLVGRREEPLTRAVADLGPRASRVAMDITHADEIEVLVATAAKQAGSPIGILVNNAGIHLKKEAVETSTEEFNAVLQTHVMAAHNLIRAILPSMLARGRGSILFTASMASLFGIPSVFAYSTAKAALLGMTRALTAEVSSKGIRVNAIAPGWIESDMTRGALAADPARRNKILSRTPMGRLGTAEDIGWAAVYLCSPAARFVTGAVLPIDGGASIGF